MTSKLSFDQVDWHNTIFMMVVCLLAVVGAPAYIIFFGLDWFQLGMFLFYVVATGMSITLGYHRLFSHLSFKASWPVRLFTLIFGACAFENSALKWVSDHRLHHKHTDHDEDPYDIRKGFIWAHIGWILFRQDPTPPMDNVTDLRKDKLVMWQYRWDKVIALVAGLLVPSILGYLWQGSWVGALGGFLISGVLRIFVVQQSTFFINSLCHTVGRRPYCSNSSARDSFLMSLFTFGEGYHNYHHEFQHDYRNGVKPWNFDPTKWAIWTLEKLGLAKDLRRVPRSKIILAEMHAARNSAEKELQRIEQLPDCDWKEKAIKSLKNLIERIQGIYEEFIAEMGKRKSELSRRCMHNWSRKTRQMLDELADIRFQFSAT
ncbi:MAG: fatty acid desaturase [Verrucomicrobiales bacterium]|nr:fatty acid desaturase [Verrucomicrobiales bacterium]